MWMATCVSFKVLQLLIKFNGPLTYDPAILLKSIYPREMKTYEHTENFIQMFVAALFVIAKNSISIKWWVENQLWSGHRVDTTQR